MARATRLPGFEIHRRRGFRGGRAARRGSHWHLLTREILPNCIAVISVKTTLDAAFIILFGATLSFLGLGVRPPTPDLGSMVADGRQFLPELWWGVLFPGLGIFYATLGFNLLGDGLRDMFDVEV